jgi:hypothetical protein
VYSVYARRGISNHLQTNLISNNYKVYERLGTWNGNMVRYSNGFIVGVSNEFHDSHRIVKESDQYFHAVLTLNTRHLNVLFSYISPSSNVAFNSIVEICD